MSKKKSHKVRKRFELMEFDQKFEVRVEIKFDSTFYNLSSAFELLKLVQFFELRIVRHLYYICIVYSYIGTFIKLHIIN